MTAATSVFKKYPNPVFVETGTHWGDGVQQALDAGFEEIYSIEISPELHKMAAHRFRANPNVHLLLADSSMVLDSVIGRINNQITFWLDSHSPESHPLLAELSIIGRHPIKTHTILIDDLRLWTVAENGFDTEVLKQIISRINPDYIFTLDGCADFPNDILVAYV